MQPSQPATDTSPAELVGLPPERRYRCGACGNLTRFDVRTREHVRRFWHADLSGAGTVDEEERSECTIESVTCRWCGSADAVDVVPVPGADDESKGPPLE